MDRAKFAENQWNKEYPDLDAEPMMLFGRLGELHQLIAHKILAPNFEKHGLQAGEFDVLATLRRSGEPFTLTPTELYKTAMISSGSMTNRIDRLCQAQLVQRLPNPKDKRGTLVQLTQQGRSVIEKVLTPHVDGLAAVLSCLEAAERQQLAELLLKLIQNVD